MTDALRIAGVVLCGGRSSRMGRPKASLPFGPETLLERVIGRLRQAADPIVVVAAANQTLPALAPEVTVVRDRHEGRGPLEGLYAGLQAVAELQAGGERVEAAFVTSCDVPFLEPAFVRSLAAELQDAEIAAPFDEQHHHPLAAVYRTSVLDAIRQLLDADQRRPFYLFQSVETHRVPTSRLRGVDPELRSLVNLNSPEDYAAALRAAGFAESGPN